MIEHPWIIAGDATGADPYMLTCERCGLVQRFDLPMSVDYFVGVAGAFEREHKRCCQRADQQPPS